MNFASPVASAVYDNIRGRYPAQNVPKEVRCEICNIQVSSYIVLRDHIAGRKHKNQFKIVSRKKNNIDLNCTICNYLCKDNNDWHDHVTGEEHTERAKVMNPQPFAEIPPPVLAFTVKPVNPQPVPPPSSNFVPGNYNNNNNIPSLFAKQEEESLRNQLNNEKALRQILAKDKKEYKCINCNIICQSKCSWDAHLISKKHRRNRHKFHTYPGISKEMVKNKYQNSFVRAAETIGNEFIEDGVVFYCKRCDVRMESKLQLEIHMTSNQHKLNHPIAPIPVATTSFPESPHDIASEYLPVRNQAQLFNFENSSYGYGFRNWNAEQHFFNRNYVPPSQQELLQHQESERQRMLVEEAKNKLLARFPFYAANLSNEPQPVPPPAAHYFESDVPELNSIPVPPTPAHLKNLDPISELL